MHEKTDRFVIGIDPGKTTGFAVYDRKRQGLVRLDATDFWGLFDIIRQYPEFAVAYVVVEVPETKHIWNRLPKEIKAIQRQAVHVGGVIREAELMAEGIRQLGYEVKTKHPLGKRTAAEFKAFTGWPGKTNEHMRDAAMLCWGR